MTSDIVDGTSMAFPTALYASPLRKLGCGAFGLVCSVRCVREANTYVAVKRLLQTFQEEQEAQRAFRELFLLWKFAEDGACREVIQLRTAYWQQAVGQQHPDVYLVTELHVPGGSLHNANLHSVIRSVRLSEEHIRFITYQILRGLKYLHSAKVIHRDLKPSNITINDENQIKIIDLGLARSYDPNGSLKLSLQVQTQPYRAPEVLVEHRHYDDRIDVWSVGCILAEMIARRPLLAFPSPVEQFRGIVRLIGPPPQHFFDKIDSCPTRDLLARMKGKDPDQALPITEDPLLREVLEALLSYDRPTAAEALKLRCFQFEGGHNPALELDYGEPIETEFEGTCSLEEWETRILELIREIQAWRALRDQ
eukprot:m.71906 g.71906  ORF g.71906 m.71906 type:complete len:366 (-) comp50209_c0_seq1:227-1324(-)